MKIEERESNLEGKAKEGAQGMGQRGSMESQGKGEAGLGFRIASQGIDWEATGQSSRVKGEASEVEGREDACQSPTSWHMPKEGQRGCIAGDQRPREP